MKWYYIFSILAFGIGCKDVPVFKKSIKDPVVARVEDRTLLLSQIKELVHERYH